MASSDRAFSELLEVDVEEKRRLIRSLCLYVRESLIAQCVLEATEETIRFLLSDAERKKDDTGRTDSIVNIIKMRRMEASVRVLLCIRTQREMILLTKG